MDKTVTDMGGIGGAGKDAQAVLNTCGGRGSVQGFLGMMADSGEELLRCRAQKGSASTVVIINHFPGVGKKLMDIFDSALGGRQVDVLSAYGHAHQQQCDGRNTKGQCDLIMTGGGGGCCDNDLPHNYAGFTAVHLTDDGGFTSDVESPAVRLGRGACSWAVKSDL